MPIAKTGRRCSGHDRPQWHRLRRDRRSCGPDGPPPTLTDLVFPLATLLGLAERPGEGHGLGTFDPAQCRGLAATAALSPYTTICVTVTAPDGIAIGHGCVKPGRARPIARGPAPPLARSRPGSTSPSPRPPADYAHSRNPGHPDRSGDRLGARPPRRRAARRPGLVRRLVAHPPRGLEFTVDLEPMPTFDCDHRNESHAYKPNAILRHLVQIRDYTCTFPPCNRHARDSDFEHAVPYDQGGRTCGCNAGARSRKCHRVKQSPGWNVTQPQPGWHQWTTPRGRTYTQGPKISIAARRISRRERWAVTGFA